MKKYTTEEIAEIVETEGIGYAIQSYLSHEQIEDELLAIYWKKANYALDSIRLILKEKLNNEM